MKRAAPPGSRAGCGCSASFKIMALSSSGRQHSPGELRRGDKGFDFCEVLALSVRPIGLGLGIHTRRTDRGDRGGDIVGTKPTGENDRDADLVDDAAAESPIVDTAERPELPCPEVVAVEQQEVGNAQIRSRDLDTGLVDDRNRPHDRDLWKARLECLVMATEKSSISACTWTMSGIVSSTTRATSSRFAESDNATRL